MNDNINKTDYIDITTPPKDILRYIILDRRKKLIDSIQFYYNKRYLGAGWPINDVKSDLFAFFDEVYSAIENDYSKKKKDFEDLEKLTKSNDIEELIKAKRIIDKWLYQKGLLKFDYIEGFDRTNTELSNKKGGF